MDTTAQYFVLKSYTHIRRFFLQTARKPPFPLQTSHFVTVFNISPASKPTAFLTRNQLHRIKHISNLRPLTRLYLFLGTKPPKNNFMRPSGFLCPLFSIFKSLSPTIISISENRAMHSFFCPVLPVCTKSSRFPRLWHNRTNDCT